VSVFNKRNCQVLSYDVLEAAENGVMTKGVVSGGRVDLCLWRITSSRSQTLCHCLVRTTTTDAAVSAWLDAVRRGFIFHTSRLVGFTTLCVCSDIRPESRFLPTPPAFDAPVRGFPSEYRHSVWRGKTKIAWLPDGEKISKISLFILMQLTNVTDGHTDRHTDTA